jgi:hypothetical protein
MYYCPLFIVRFITRSDSLRDIYVQGELAKEEFSYPYPYVVDIDMLLYLTDGYTHVEISLSYSVNCSARYRYMSTPRASHKKEASFETHW